MCARAYLDESRSQEGEAVFVRFIPLSLLSRLHLFSRFTLQCSCILQSPHFRTFCFCAESGEGVHIGYHMALTLAL